MHGAKSPHKADWTLLAGRNVTIWPDRDVAGGDFARTVKELASAAGAESVDIVDVPTHWPESWDLADPIPDGANRDVLEQLLVDARQSRLVEQEEARNAPAYVSFPPYRMTVRGLLRDGQNDEPSTWLSEPFEVLAQTRDPHSSQWGLLLRWTDPDGRVHEWAMPKEALGGGREEIWRSLARDGLGISAAAKARNFLADYLSQARPPGRACALSRIGWHTIDDKMVFVLPDQTFGKIPTLHGPRPFQPPRSSAANQ